MAYLVEEAKGIGTVYDQDRVFAEVEYSYEWYRRDANGGLPAMDRVDIRFAGLPLPRPERLTLQIEDGRKIDFDFSGPECKVLGVPY